MKITVNDVVEALGKAGFDNFLEEINDFSKGIILMISELDKQVVSADSNVKRKKPTNDMENDKEDK